MGSKRRVRKKGSGDGVWEGPDVAALFDAHWERAEALLTCLEAGLRASLVLLADTRVVLAAPARLAATLVFDSRMHRSPAGARAVGTGAEAPRLLYRADRTEVDLEVVGGTGDGRLRLLGQIAADGIDSARARVVATGPSGQMEAAVDDLGQFVLDGLVAGRHRLEVGLADELIEVPALDL